MADATNSIFNKKATEKLRSPDDLDKYLQVTNPGIWVVLLACIALIAGLLAWGLFGAVETSVSTMGAVISVDGDDEGKAKPMCFLSIKEIEEVEVGDTAIIGEAKMTVSDVKAVPMSAGEVKNLIHSDYLFSTLVQGDWVYAVTFEGDASQLPQDVPLQVKITVNSVTPISLIFRSNG